MRSMRQVIKTNHNFVTGEHYEQRMLKPVQEAQNRVTIQLCDADTGNVIEEAVTENAITPLFECSAYGSIAQQLNYGLLYGGCGYPAFESIVLSDSDIGELEDLYFIHGNVVGMCNREDTAGAGSHKQRGTYNSAESYSKVEDNGYRHIHLVYDWPTSAGNGKIQNIYWLPNSFSYSYPNSTRAIACMQTYNDRYSGSDVLFDRRGNLYRSVYVSGNTYGTYKYYKILNMLKFVNGIESAKVATEESFHNIYEVNGYYYTFSSSCTGDGSTSFTATLTINKHDTNGNVIDTWTEDLITSVPQLVELKNNSKLVDAGASVRAYCDYDGWVGFQISFNEYSSYNDFPTRNSAGELEPNKTYNVSIYSMYNVLTKQWLHTPSPWDVWCTYEHYTDNTVLKKIDNKHMTTSGMYITIDTNNADVAGEQYTINWKNLGDEYSHYYPLSMHPTLPLCTCTGRSNDDGEMSVIRPISAQTRLASPITKTSLNTMKIQYDFFFKIPLPYMPPEHVWDLYK